ncbi:uncharacterized protein LOC113272272 [Papaver somniferum]|uniref:uncharacterized protein LOC113272272 n=1 Tax=Papaver somniferum TaxID=3469 RepID=UPI000E6F8732|nr:uncharacterized protein LOC113272272 [Papaver somniferum]
MKRWCAKELKEGIDRLKISLPGFGKDDIKVIVEGTSLVITSLLGKEEEDEKPAGDFVSVGPDVNEDDAAALALGGKRKYGYIGENSTCPDAKDPKYEDWIADDQLWDELNTYRPHTTDAKILLKRVEEDKIFDVLSSLTSEYESLRSTILMSAELPSLSSVCATVQREETRKKVTNPVSKSIVDLDAAESSALLSSRDDKRRAIPFDKDKNSRAKGKREVFHCDHCNKTGHTKDRCWDIYPHLKVNFDKNKLALAPVADNSSFTIDQLKDFFYQLGNKNERKANHTSGNLLAFLTTPFSNRHIWITDSGATYHMVNDPSSVHAVIRSSHKNVSVANGSTSPVMGSGKVHFFPDCPSSNALVVPSFPTQLFSVGQITNSQNCDVTFTPTSVIFQDRKTKKTIGRGIFSHGLYLLRSSDMACLTQRSTPQFLYHQRLGHPSSRVLSRIFPTFSVQSQVKNFRSDNGTEFVKVPLPGYLRSHGIIHQTSCVGTSQQNGVAERKLRHILETTRALMIQMHVPKKFWSHGSLTATYLINRLPSRVLEFKSPLEVLKHHQPGISHHRVFGCVCYVHLQAKHRDKLDSRWLIFSVILAVGLRGGYTYLAPLPVINEIPTATASHRDNGDGVELVDVPNAVLDVHNEAVHEEASDNNVSVTDDNTRLQDVPHQVPETEVMVPQDHQPVVPIVRTSSREKKAPEKYKDFFTYHSAAYPIQAHLTYDHVGSSHSAFLSAISSHQEPKNYNEAKSNPKWRAPMENELRALDVNNTYSIVKFPSGKKTVGCRWVYKIKYRSDGTVERYKARLVARGFTQRYGEYYTETFAPVEKMNTFSVLMYLAVNKDWKLFQMDLRFLALKLKMVMLKPQDKARVSNSNIDLVTATQTLCTTELKETMWSPSIHLKCHYSLWLRSAFLHALILDESLKW